MVVCFSSNHLLEKSCSNCSVINFYFSYVMHIDTQFIMQLNSNKTGIHQ